MDKGKAVEIALKELKKANIKYKVALHRKTSPEDLQNLKKKIAYCEIALEAIAKLNTD